MQYDFNLNNNGIYRTRERVNEKRRLKRKIRNEEHIRLHETYPPNREPIRRMPEFNGDPMTKRITLTDPLELAEILGTFNGSNISDGFRALDRNSDGRLDFPEFLLSLTRLRIDFSMEIAQAAFASFDSDGDGFVDFRDFVAAFLKTPKYTLERIQIMFEYVNGRNPLLNSNGYLQSMHRFGFYEDFSQDELLQAFHDVCGSQQGINLNVFQNLVSFFEAERNWKRLKHLHHDDKPFLREKEINNGYDNTYRKRFETQSLPRYSEKHRDPTKLNHRDPSKIRSQSQQAQHRVRPKRMQQSAPSVSHSVGALRRSNSRTRQRRSSPNDAPKIKKYRVCLKEGCPLTRHVSAASELITVLPYGTTVHVAEREGNRVRINYPINGWCSLESSGNLLQLQVEQSRLSHSINNVEKKITQSKGYTARRMSTLKDLKKFFKNHVRINSHESWALIFFQFDLKSELQELLDQSYAILLEDLYFLTSNFLSRSFSKLAQCTYSPNNQRLSKVSVNSLVLVARVASPSQAVKIARAIVDNSESSLLIKNLPFQEHIKEEIDQLTNGKLTTCAGVACYQNEQDFSLWLRKAYFASKLARNAGLSRVGEWHLWWDSVIEKT